MDRRFYKRSLRGGWVALALRIFGIVGLLSGLLMVATFRFDASAIGSYGIAGLIILLACYWLAAVLENIAGIRQELAELKDAITKPQE